MMEIKFRGCLLVIWKLSSNESNDREVRELNEHWCEEDNR